MNAVSTDFRNFEDREAFALSMVSGLNDMLTLMLGPEQTDTAVALVAGYLAEDMSEGLAERTDGVPLSAHQLAEALVEMKRRIGGAFEIVSVTDDRIVFRNTRCPFAGREAGRTSLCQMTSGVFGKVAARQTGHARVTVAEALAFGDAQCLVILDLSPGAAPLPAQARMPSKVFTADL